jgi:hypothetical protein
VKLRGRSIAVARALGERLSARRAYGKAVQPPWLAKSLCPAAIVILVRDKKRQKQQPSGVSDRDIAELPGANGSGALPGLDILEPVESEMDGWLVCAWRAGSSLTRAAPIRGTHGWAAACGKPIQLPGMLHHRPEREGERWQSKGRVVAWDSGLNRLGPEYPSWCPDSPVEAYKNAWNRLQLGL